MGREGKNTGGWENGKNVSVTCRPQWAPQAEQRETEKKKLFPNLLRSEEKKETKSSLVPSSHTKGARAHARRRFTPMYTLQRAAARTHTHTHRNPTVAPQMREEGVPTTSPPSPSSSTRCSVSAGKIPASKKKKRNNNNNNKTRAHHWAASARPPSCVPHTATAGGREEKKKKKENSARQPRALLSRNRTSAVAQRISFHPTALVVGAGTRHTQHPHSMRAHAHI